MAKAFVSLTASQQLARQLQRQIDQGAWAVGSTLPSMRELASRYGVSLTTVQKAMRDLCEQDVIDLRPRMGGVVKAARSRQDQIALVIGLDPAVQHPLWWHNAIVHAAQVILAESGYRVSLFNFLFNKPDPAEQVISAMQSSVDSLAGVFGFLCEGIDRMCRFFDECDLPWMTVNPIDLRTHHNFVMADNIAGGRQVGRCFVRLGYERIAILHDELKNVSPLEKVSGICQAYLENDLSPSGIELVKCADMAEESALRAMREHLRTHAPPQGIFATGDTLAVGAMRACQEIGLRIPQDVGAVGSTGVPNVMLHCTPSLTELCQPVQEMGRQLALCLLEMIRGGVRRLSGRRIPCPFVLRDSLNLPDDIRRELELELAPEGVADSTSEQPAESVRTDEKVLSGT